MPKDPPFREIGRSNTCISYRNAGNVHAVILLHGLGGNNSKYWGRLIELMNFDFYLKDMDFYYWRYNTSKFWFMAPLFRPGSHERLSTIPELGAALASEATAWISEFKYQRVSLIGHSLGGFIALHVIRRLIKTGTVPIKNVCLMGTPQRVPALAWFAAQLLQDLNPHLQFLAQGGEIQDLLSSGLSEASSQGIKSTYIQCVGDALLATYENQHFSETIDLQGAHNWMLSIAGRNDSRYSILRSYLLRC